MTENSHILRWPEGAGWIVLSGGNDSLSAIRAQVLRKANPDGGIAYIGLSVDDADDIMDDMAELGAPTGYLVNIVTEDDETIRSELLDASVIVVSDENRPSELRSALMGAARDAMREAHEAGATILAEGSAAALFGAVFVSGGDEVLSGFNWLEGAYIVPGVTSISESELARSALATNSAALVVGIGDGSALALGPTASVETWGDQQISIGLGGKPT